MKRNFRRDGLPLRLAGVPELRELERVRDELRLEVQRARAAVSRPFRITPLPNARRPTS